MINKEINMNRKIKFRCWDVEKRCWIPEGMFVIRPHDGKVCTWNKIEKRFIEETIEYKLMQSTGLKDKNGVDIFEGDILDDGVEISSGKQLWIIGWYQQEHRMGRSHITNPEDYFYSIDGIEEIKIIGNIYQTPDLLKG